jgi:hypothetical protein
MDVSVVLVSPMVLTHFIVSGDVQRSRRFYTPKCSAAKQLSPESQQPASRSPIVGSSLAPALISGRTHHDPTSPDG